MPNIFLDYNHKIGDYIHGRFNNYTKFGINYDEVSNPMQELKDMHDAMLDESRFGGSITAAKTLQDDLNLFFGKPRSNSDSLMNSGFTEEERRIITEEMTKAMENYIDSNLQIDWDRGAAEYITDKDPSLLLGGKTLGRIDTAYKLQGESQVRFSTIKKRMELMMNSYQNNLQKALASGKPVNENLKQQLEQLKAQWINFEKQVDSMSDTKNQGSSDKLLKYDGSTKSIIDFYNKIYSEFRFSQARAMGALGEYMSPFILYALTIRGNREFGKLMTEFAKGINNPSQTSSANNFRLTGQEKTHRLIDTSNIVSKTELFLRDINMNDDDQEVHIYRNGVGGLLSVKASQDKVDVEIDDYKEENYKLNVKNYNFANALASSRDITLHSGNILRLIQDESNFINHWLNIFSGASIGKSGQGEFATQARANMYLLLLIKGLEGEMLIETGSHTKRADYFVVNDASTGFFSVLPISEIIRLAKQTKSIKNLVHIDGAKRLESVDGNWERDGESKNGRRLNRQSAYRRIRKSIVEFAKTNVKIQLATKSFTDYLKSRR